MTESVHNAYTILPKIQGLEIKSEFTLRSLDIVLKMALIKKMTNSLSQVPGRGIKYVYTYSDNMSHTHICLPYIHYLAGEE